MTTIWSDFVKRVERDIEEAKSFLKPLETGEMHLASRPSGGSWEDTTQQHIDREKSIIASFSIAMPLIRSCPVTPQAQQ
jgi:hypothetical protein